jgi:hypothetical protein
VLLAAKVTLRPENGVLVGGLTAERFLRVLVVDAHNP